MENCEEMFLITGWILRKVAEKFPFSARICDYFHCTKYEVFHSGFFQSHLLKKSLMENFILCAVFIATSCIYAVYHIMDSITDI